MPEDALGVAHFSVKSRGVADPHGLVSLRFSSLQYRFMKVLSALLLGLSIGAASLGQSPAVKPESRATVEGIVVKEPGGEPVKKALIELIAENQTEGGDYTATTGPDGAFHIDGVLPGRYRLFAERTGFLEESKHRGRSEGRVLTLTAGQELKDVQIRFEAAAVVRGRITDEDGDPMADAQVAILRQTYVSGHSKWQQVGSERSNDLGEFRVANLPSGNYYVSVSPPPDFKSLIAAGGAGADTKESADKPATTYQTTYYPGTPDRSQAASIQLRPGDEFPVNFSLTPTPSLSIRGAVVNLPPHSSASIMLQSRDFGLVFNGAEVHKDGTFVIRDVSPGSYTILATVDNSPVPLTARQALQIASSSVDGVRLAPQPGAMIRGRVRFDGRGRIDAEKIFLALQSTDHNEDSAAMSMVDAFSNLAHLSPDGSFEWKDVPAGNYYVQLVGQGDVGQDLFVKSIGGRSDDSALSVNGGTMMLDVAISTSGAVIDGIATNAKGEPFPNAIVVAVPEERLRVRMDRYRKSMSDQTGHFTLNGLPPGTYTLFAWESIDGEAYYSPEFLAAFEGQGTGMRVAEGDRKSAQLVVIPSTDDQP